MWKQLQAEFQGCGYILQLYSKSCSRGTTQGAKNGTIYSKRNKATISKTRRPRLFLFLRSIYNKSKVIFKMSARKWICFQNCIDYSKRFGYNR